MFDEQLKERFFNRYKFSKHDSNKFVLFLWKGVDPYEYMYDLKTFNETSIPKKEEFYRNLNMEDITDADYTDTKKSL